MRSFLEDDLDAFADNEFSDEVTLDGTAGVSGTKKDEYVEITTTSGVPYHGIKATFYTKESNLTGKNGKTLIHDDGTYKIIDIQKDGTGMALAILEATA